MQMLGKNPHAEGATGTIREPSVFEERWIIDLDEPLPNMMEPELPYDFIFARRSEMDEIPNTPTLSRIWPQ